MIDFTVVYFTRPCSKIYHVLLDNSTWFEDTIRLVQSYLGLRDFLWANKYLLDVQMPGCELKPREACKAHTRMCLSPRHLSAFIVFHHSHTIGETGVCGILTNRDPIYNIVPDHCHARGCFAVCAGRGQDSRASGAPRQILEMTGIWWTDTATGDTGLTVKVSTVA